jgi:hypothetical protein
VVSARKREEGGGRREEGRKRREKEGGGRRKEEGGRRNAEGEWISDSDKIPAFEISSEEMTDLLIRMEVSPVVLNLTEVSARKGGGRREEGGGKEEGGSPK